jgi:thiamine biosynthesis protein ThiS
VVEQTSLEDLLVTLALPRERVAVELNQKVVRRVDWPVSTLREGDKIEIVHFVGGG